MIIINDKRDCCGCTACASVCQHGAIEMCRDDEGFYYPNLMMDRCIDCGLCEQVCPILYRKEKKYIIDNQCCIYALYNKNDNIRMTSSSGGVFYSLACNVINKNGVVFGAVYDSKMRVVHAMVNNLSDVESFKGSKYVQSDLHDVFKTIRLMLKNGRWVLFSGTPCQVEGLKLFLRKDYDNLLTCDIICHGVPSPLIFSDYIRFVEDKYRKKLLSINMKDKIKGWRSPRVALYFDDGTVTKNTFIANLWHKIFFSHFCTRPSCHACQYTNYNRPGDVTIGDYWGIEKSHPTMDDNKGTSLLFVNTVKGKKLFDEIKNDFLYAESTKDLCSQPQLNYPSKVNPRRGEFWKSYKFHGFMSVYNDFFYVSPLKRFWIKIKWIIKTLFKKASKILMFC